MATDNPPTVRLADAMDRAVALHRSGDLAGAERWLESVLAAKPTHFDALHLLGVVAAQMGRFAEADTRFRAAIAVDPQSMKAHVNRASVLRALGRRGEALSSCERALAIEPGAVSALATRAAILKELGRLSEALASCDRALASDPQSAPTLNVRGAIAQDLGRYEEALANYDGALAIQPEFPEALSNRGGLRNVLQQHQEALADCERATALRPSFSDAWYNRGLALSALGRHDEAAKSYTRALELHPDMPMALQSRAGALTYLGRHPEAAVDLQRILALDPEFPFARGMLLQARLHLCDWRDFDAVRGRMVTDVRNGKRACDPFTFLAISDKPGDQLQCARTWIAARYPPASTPLFRATPRPRNRIHVAYVSAEFREHAVAFLSAGLFERHDRQRFETTALSLGAHDDGPMRKRLRPAFDRFLEVGSRSDREIAELIRDLDVDILVDMGGLTGSARTGVFALRPAPVQVNFLGFTATMGAPYIDYLIADAVVIPNAECGLYAESVVQLPGSFQVNDAKRPIADATPTRADAGLPEDAFVFCSFNNTFKIAPDMFACWMRLLNAVQGSVLWLLEGNPHAPGNLRREAAALGVAPERLVFAPKVAPMDHLARHRLADLFLDTLPFNAHTTASDALWAGLPVLTCEGTTFAGRVASSLLHAVGLPELVMPTREEYEATALHLARHRDALAQVRAKLAANLPGAPLFDTDRYRRHLESAYDTMWQRCLAGGRPTSFAVNPVD